MSEYWLPIAEDEWMLLRHPYAEIYEGNKGWYWRANNGAIVLDKGGPLILKDAQNAASAALAAYEEANQ